MRIHTIALAAAAASLLLPAAAAQAATAFASTDVHVRAGPGVGNRIVDVLRAGERVRVDRCNRGYSWCYVSHAGPDGWVSARYLNDRRYGSSRPLSRFGFSLNIPQLNFRVGVGPQGPYARPGRRLPRRTAQVCFYEDFNYQGRHFCARPGQRDRRLGGFWNDRISSIRVTGDASVRVCDDFNFNGRCTVLSNNRRRIGGRNNDVISSYRVM